ncbi:hypothetical protein [Halorussus halobius]|uniref:hypothetical protein n=1 Tax=Halorussus halobius TaxID=1710537 RepID=UPI001092EB36|nr:hypothetical protein [Halorussus halobius]
MSSVLSSEGGEQGRSTDARERAATAVTTAMERAGSDGERSRAFLVIDLGSAVGSLFGRGDGSSAVVEAAAERGRRAATDDRERTSQRGGRGTLATLFVLGAVAGLGYVLQRRMGSVDEVVDQATEQVQTVADRTEMRSGEAAEQTEEVAGAAADRIEETGGTVAEQVESGSEEVAERVREGGEEAADTVQEGGERAAEQMEEAGERAEETADESEVTADEDEAEESEE